jgi:hypothetical protein
MNLLVIVALAIALGVLLLVKLRKPSEPRTTVRKSGSRSAGAGVSSAPAPGARVKAPSEAIDKFRGGALFPQKDPCEAILKLRGKTFPEGRIPRIPVPGCDRGECACQVHEIVGRRRGPRRISTDRRGDVRFKEDRRSGRDRREGVETWKNAID